MSFDFKTASSILFLAISAVTQAPLGGASPVSFDQADLQHITPLSPPIPIATGLKGKNITWENSEDKYDYGLRNENNSSLEETDLSFWQFSMERMISNALATLPEAPESLQDPQRLGLDYIKYGKMFEGNVIIHQIQDQDGNFRLNLVWGNHFTQETIKKGHFLLINQQVARDLKNLHFDKEIMIRLFQYLKNMIPHQFVNDGCNPRCLWSLALLQEVFNVDSYKIKVWAKENPSLSTSPPFPEGVKWTMHTAPVLIIDGEEYVFDLTLERPMLLEEWKKYLYGKDLVTIGIAKKWDQPCLTYATTRAVPDEFEDVQKSLRALYLFEVIDGNDQKNSSLEKWGWDHQAIVVRESAQEEKRETQSVVISIKKLSDKLIVKKKELIFSEERFKNLVLHEGTYYTQSALKSHLFYELAVS